ncbi:MAG: type II toxin-antitoxin system VapC family toxin [Candidatus Latescibacterota bacterium]
MTLLLDTHVLLWWLDDPSLLSEAAHSAIADGGNPVLVSAAVAWEIAVQKALGKLEAPDDLAEVLQQERFEELPIRIRHALAVASLPAIHQDPFDRIRVAQAQLEGLTLVRRDRRMQRYDVRCLRA